MISGTGISIILCCHNSATRLPATLKHLAAQQLADDTSCELILVNNVSSDDTVTVAQKKWAQYPSSIINFKIVNEDTPGLSFAREKGIQSATHEIIVFCDDDNWLSPDYVMTAYKFMQDHPKVAALGGQSQANANVPLPTWFDNVKNHYAVGKQAPASGDVTQRTFLWGSGIVIRKSLYLKAFHNFPSLLTGRKGNELSSGEDSEMCLRFILMGYHLYYLEQLQFTHFMETSRLSEAYYQRMSDGFVSAYHQMSDYRQQMAYHQLSPAKKYKEGLMSGLRLIIHALTGIKRWDIPTETKKLYQLSGLKFRSIPLYLVKIRQLAVIDL